MADLEVTPIVALDVATAEAALGFVDRLGDSCRFYKVGSELFTASGPAVVDGIGARGSAVFLDLKFHDIPNTVRAAVRSASTIGARLVTVHASGGRAMLEAAAEGASVSSSGAAPRCKVLAVSVLTSLTGQALAESWGRSDVDVAAEVLRLASLARDCGVDGLVCSALEARAVRRELGAGFELLVPGIRLSGTSADDQARTATPAEARAAGATYMILGRTVTAAADPRVAMQRVLDEIRIPAGPLP